ncbi:hypothetical protein [Shewanella colwelliana]|uniref:hypothetical protein n=1 Tax=Shewanella colwelliana TaxID=23 RepID=UPI001C7D846C|nr:hypothetical protein [Shewanella colwelliana]
MLTGFSPTIIKIIAIFTILFFYDGVLELNANRPLPPEKIIYLLIWGFIYCLFQLQSVKTVPSRIRQSSVSLVCIGFLMTGFCYTYGYTHPSNNVLINLSPLDQWFLVGFVLLTVLMTWKCDNSWRLDDVPNKSGLSFGVRRSGAHEIIQLHFSGTARNVIHGLNGLVRYCGLINENRKIELCSPLLSNPRYFSVLTRKLDSIKNVEWEWSLSPTPYVPSTLERLLYTLQFSIKSLKFNSTFWKIAQQDWQVMTISLKP